MSPPVQLDTSVGSTFAMPTFSCCPNCLISCMIGADCCNALCSALDGFAYFGNPRQQ